MSDLHSIFNQTIQVLPLSLAIIGGMSFMLASYFDKPRMLFQTIGVMTLVLAALSGYGNWLPQVEGGFGPPKEVKLDVYNMPAQQLADEGEKIIFGGLGQSRVQGAIGRGQCPLCHGFMPELLSERAPNLYGIPKRAKERLNDPRYHLGKPQERDTVQKEAFLGSGTATTAIEYIAESAACPSCYVVAGYGLKSSNDTENPGEPLLEAPIDLSIDDMIAIDTWLYIHSGETPPPPIVIEEAYKKFVPESKWKSVTRTSIGETDPRPPLLMADGTEPVDKIFSRAQCVACHTIPGIPGAIGTIGPKLIMKTIGPSRIKDRNYHGKARTIREYITESILYPSIYVPTGTVDNTMPKVFGTKLSGGAIDKMVDYLAQVEEGKAPPPIK
jgi:mono/diheme cytochrome c family protein